MTFVPVEVCEHGKVRAWAGLARAGDQLPDIERCPVCDADTVELDAPKAGKSGKGQPPVIIKSSSSAPVVLASTYGASLVIEADEAGEKRVLSGLAVPWNDVGYTSLGPVRYLPGSIDAAARPPVDRNHDSSAIVGVVKTAASTDQGITAKARISRTSAGDDLLALADDGAVTGFSTTIKATEYAFEESDEHGLVMVVSAGEWQALSVVPYPAFDAARIKSIAASHHNPQSGGKRVTVQQLLALIRGTDVDKRGDLLTEHDETIKAAGFTPDAILALATAGMVPPDEKPTEPVISGGKPRVMTEIGSLGEYAKKRYAGEVDPKEAKLIEAALSDVLTTDIAGLMPPTWVKDFAEEIAAARPTIEAFETRPLPNTGMVVTYPLVTARPTAAAQAVQKTEVESSPFTITTANAAVKTWAGANDLAVQAIQRSDPSLVDMLLQELGYAMAEVEDIEVGAAILTAVTQTETLSAASVETINAILASAAAQVFAAKRGAVPNVFVAGLGVWEFLAGASDTEGRPLFPNINGANPVGTLSFSDQNGNVRGLNFFGDPNLPAAKAVMGWKRAVTTWLGPVQTMTLDQPAILGRDVAVYQFGTYAVRRPDALVEITLGA